VTFLQHLFDREQVLRFLAFWQDLLYNNKKEE